MRESDALESELCVTELFVTYNTWYTIRGSSANKYIPKCSKVLNFWHNDALMPAQFVIN